MANTNQWPNLNQLNIKILGLFQDDNGSDQNSTRPSSSSQTIALFKTALILADRYNISLNGQSVGWSIQAFSGDSIEVMKTICDILSSEKILGIVGPRRSQETHSAALLAGAIGLPVLAYAATDPELSSRKFYPTLFRFIPSDGETVNALIQLFRYFNWSSCVVVYQTDSFGYSGMRYITEYFMKHDIKVRDLYKFDTRTFSFQYNIRDYMVHSGTRIVILWANAEFTPHILRYAIDNDILGPHFTWILTSSPSLDVFKNENHRHLVGMLSIEPVTGGIYRALINNDLLEEAFNIWETYEPKSFPGRDYVDQYALFAFDATWSLLQSLIHLSEDLAFSNNTRSCFDQYIQRSHLLIKKLTEVDLLGVTGSVRFNEHETDRQTGVYYLIRNILSLERGIHFVPVLKYNHSNGWQLFNEQSTVIWPDRTLSVPNDRPMLKGVTLNIAVIPSNPFVIVDTVKNDDGKNITTITGYIPDLIEMLREKMGFIPNITTTPPNTSYSRHLEAVSNGRYDLLIGDVTETVARRRLVSFSSAIFDNALRIVVRRPISGEVDLFSYLRPFSKNLWLFILAATIYASILVGLLERNENVAFLNRPTLSICALSIWYCIGTIMGYGADFHATTASGRLLTIALYLLSLVLIASYTANLASKLSTIRPSYLVNNIDDMKDGKIPHNRIGILQGTAIEEYFVREVSRGSRNFYPLSSRRQLLDSLLNDQIDASFLDSGVAEYITNHIFCNLTLVGEAFNHGSFGIVMSKNWPYQHDLDVNILSLREKGQLTMLRKKWFQSRICESSPVIPTAMQFESMAGLFLTFAIITCIAFLQYLWNNRKNITNHITLVHNQIKRTLKVQKISNQVSNNHIQGH